MQCNLCKKKNCENYETIIYSHFPFFCLMNENAVSAHFDEILKILNALFN